MAVEFGSTAASAGIGVLSGLSFPNQRPLTSGAGAGTGAGTVVGVGVVADVVADGDGVEVVGTVVVGVVPTGGTGAGVGARAGVTTAEGAEVALVDPAELRAL